MRAEVTESAALIDGQTAFSGAWFSRGVFDCERRFAVERRGFAAGGRKCPRRKKSRRQKRS